ncbi:hypothetical protein Dvina_00635 [Dactylosporangium vinaceum]|uniref:DUF6232 family protein n=1 Tax=Dactylosporangium vinaceum TaxID=53362 RepID=A0ABV5MPF8_9ACTN|nr:DUF6232 family protein [Dactylosporangium vinaceum]UAB96780.1 hypothetical protein Dvina_00635 [Dactylosporangium vinaceum]
MPTFYRGPGVRITDERFWVLGPDPRSYAIADLQHIGIVHTENGRAMAVLRTSCAGTAAAVAAITFAETDLSQPVGWVCVLLAVGIGVLQINATVEAPARRSELWAFDSSHEQDVCLYTTRDLREFGRVRRALVRAKEWNTAGAS